jgi:hypothetical protein
VKLLYFYYVFPPCGPVFVFCFLFFFCFWSIKPSEVSLWLTTQKAKAEPNRLGLKPKWQRLQRIIITKSKLCWRRIRKIYREGIVQIITKVFIFFDMMMAIGLSQYNVALMHTVNHAFFKALLFLGAGVNVLAINPAIFWKLLLYKARTKGTKVLKTGQSKGNF